MILILHSDATATLSGQIANDLREAFKDHIVVSTASASSENPWPSGIDWDDLLVVVYDDAPFPPSGSAFISEYLATRNGLGLILPVATVAGRTRPPMGADHIKAFEIDATSAGVHGTVVKRVGAMIGLRLQQRENEIFISYRATDGRHFAEQLEAHLKSLGFPVWRDEARELDGTTRILPGSPVQNEIDRALDKAAAVLLLDTPEAPHSIWIKHEVDTANGLLIPVLPLCFRATSDRKKGPRFSSLLQLQRWVDIAHTAGSLTPFELQLVVSEMETYLSDILRRKCRVPFIVEREFTTREFSWNILDRRHLMTEAKRVLNPRLTTRVLSHCSLFDHVYGPALDRFAGFLKNSGNCNHSLYIYDGELIPEPELNDIIKKRPSNEGVVILHHQELAALIDSHFTKLSP